MKLRIPRPRQFGSMIRDLARSDPVEAEAYLDTHQEAWEELAERNPHDAADILEAIDEGGAADLLRDLDADDAADVLDEMRPEAAADVLQELEPARAAEFVSEMETDQAVDVIEALDPADRDALLAALDPVTATEVGRLLAYAPDTAGGMMTTDIAALPVGMTAGEAIESLRRLHEELGSNLSYVYVVDDDGRLLGVVSFRDMVFARPGSALNDVMEPNVVSVQTGTDREQVAELVQRYRLVAIPVVDDGHRLVGMVKVGEALDAIQAEAGEDMAVMFGAGDQESVFTPVSESVRRRLPWNIFNLVAGFVTVFVVAQFEDTLATYSLLAAFMPLVAGLSGNSGAQAIAVTIRSLAVGDLPPGREFRAIRRELMIGLVRGLVLATIGAVLAAIAVGVLGGGDEGLTALDLGVIVWISTIVGLMTAALVGSSIPLILRRLGQDPALASNIFLTMITDAVGFGIFLLTATMLL